jgi:methylated-DNA-protein-cysteine methyltransferase-like protein
VNFYQQVYALVRAIPYGKVATYGQIAAILGSPRAARMVGQALKHCDSSVPWQRVINRHGMISIENLRVTKDDQAELLRREGVEVEERDGNFWVDLKKHLVTNEELESKHMLLAHH